MNWHKRLYCSWGRSLLRKEKDYLKMTTLLNSCPWSGWLFWRQKNSRQQTRGCIHCISCSYSVTFVFMQFSGKMKRMSAFCPQEKKNDWFHRYWSRKVGRYWPRALTFRILSIINTDLSMNCSLNCYNIPGGFIGL